MAVLFDKNLVFQRRTRALGFMPESAFIVRHAAEALRDRMRDIQRPFHDILYIGFEGDYFKGLLADTPCRVTIMNFADDPTADMIADPEALPLASAQFDLIVSNLCLHHVNDLPGALIQARLSLKPDGLFLGAVFGGDTLHELKQSLIQAEINVRGGAASRIAPMIDIRDMGALLQRGGFTLPVVDRERLKVSYADAIKLMHDLRGMGEANPLLKQDKTIPKAALFPLLDALYKRDFPDGDGRIVATFELLFLSGWHPHDSQQKPLRPGSGQVSLHDVLGGKTK